MEATRSLLLFCKDQRSEEQREGFAFEHTKRKSSEKHAKNMNFFKRIARYDSDLLES